jgi:hypothetical protein
MSIAINSSVSMPRLSDTNEQTGVKSSTISLFSLEPKAAATYECKKLRSDPDVAT